LESCTSENDPNTSVIPTSDSLLLTYSDTTTLTAFIELDDTIRTDATERVLLGSMYDPVFGRCTSAFYSTFTISQSLNTELNTYTVDSVILTMRAEGGYGDLSKFTGYQVLEVFELTEDIPDAPIGGYNSTTSFDYNPVPLATYGFSPQFFPLGTEPSSIRIKLNPAFGNRFFATPNDTVNSANVRDYIKGIYVRINPTVTAMQSPGQGGMAYFKLNSDVSSLKVYYRKNSGTVTNILKFPMATTSNKRVNVFEHFDYVDADPALQTKLADTTNTIVSDKLYIQALNGIRIKVKMPYLMNYVDSGPIIVNRAEFVLPIDPTQDLHLYDEPDNLMAYYLGSDGLIHFMPDIPYTYYDSFLDPVTQQYKIVLTQYVQKILNGENIPSEFYFDIPVLAKYTDAFRMVLNSPEHATKPMKLNLTYTRIPSL